LNINHLLLLALIQGITEFLPISSSAHLILLPYLAGWRDQGLAFDVAAHLGTLIAVVGYFRRELLTMTVDWLQSCRGRGETADSRLMWAVLIGTIPAGLAGILIHDIAATAFRSPLLIAATTIGFGALLWLADRGPMRVRTEYSLSWREVFYIGAAQALALVPGTSRSGITITAGLLLGLSREGAARFSFLLAVPLIFCAVAMEIYKLSQAPVDAHWGSLALTVALSCVSAYLVIFFFLKLLERIGMLPFVIYRFLLGAVLLWLYLP
jgi:undecaprenyl-diphosphatase